MENKHPCPVYLFVSIWEFQIDVGNVFEDRILICKSFFIIVSANICEPLWYDHALYV